MNANTLATRVWSSTATRKGGVVHVGGLALPDLVAEVNTPAYVIDEDDFRARARAFKEAFDGWDVYYAGKAFLCTEIARWVVQEGLHLDVCSAGELTVAERAGVDPALLGYHGNNKTTQELRRAASLGVGRVIVDSFDEIERIQALASELVAAGSTTPIRVLIRVTPGVEVHTHEFISTAHQDQKFGFSLAGGDAFRAARLLIGVDGVEFRGLHAHIGSQIFDLDGHQVATRRLLGLAARVRAELGLTIAELDLGGGFGIAYTGEDDPLDPEALAEGLNAAVDAECEALDLPRPHLSIEPGRAIVGPSGCTVYTVGTVKEVPLDEGRSRTYVSVDGGMSDNIRTALYDATYSVAMVNRDSSSGGVVSRVVGKHCETGDIVVRDAWLPGDVTPGDLLAVPATGAYCRSMSNNYNHALRPPVVAVKDGAFRVIVRRETEEDLLATDMGVL